MAVTASARARWVLDTSVVVKWFLDEPHSHAAERFLEAAEAGTIEALAPASLLFEAANVFWVRRRDGVTAELAAKFLEALKLVDLVLVGGEELFPAAQSLAFELSISPYDAAFLWLARERQARFLTADSRLAEAVRDRVPGVVLLGEGVEPV